MNSSRLFEKTSLNHRHGASGSYLEQVQRFLYKKLLQAIRRVRGVVKAYMLPIRIRHMLRKVTGWASPALEWLSAPWRYALSFGAALAGRWAQVDITDGLPGRSSLPELSRRFYGEYRAGPHFQRWYEFLKWRFRGTGVCRGTGHFAHPFSGRGLCGTWRNVALEGLNSSW